MLDVDKVTLDEIDEEIDHVIDRLERLTKLREAVADQNQRRVQKLLSEYHAVLREQARA
jgi:hypothetical protein